MCQAGCSPPYLQYIPVGHNLRQLFGDLGAAGADQCYGPARFPCVQCVEEGVHSHSGAALERKERVLFRILIPYIVTQFYTGSAVSCTPDRRECIFHPVTDPGFSQEEDINRICPQGSLNF